MIHKGPVKEIPGELLGSYTMNGAVPVIEWLCDGALSSTPVWSEGLVNRYLAWFSKRNILEDRRRPEPYPPASSYFVSAFESHPVRDKSVAVVGSQSPWIEAIAINCGAGQLTTVEYNVPRCSHPAIRTISYEEFEQGRPEFDCVITYSSVEHSGLGRYGEVLDPDGDLKSMKAVSNSLGRGGLLFWGAPVGKDALVWNAHRIYGPRRLPLLFADFQILNWFGFARDSMKHSTLGDWRHQPLAVLKKKARRAERIVLDKTLMSHEAGACYSLSFPEYHMPFDHEDDPAGSTLRLYENEVLLAGAHSAREEIIDLGAGRYSHWHDTLYFSARDNSDPRTGGNVYSIELW